MEPQNTEEDIWAAHVLMRLASVRKVLVPGSGALLTATV